MNEPSLGPLLMAAFSLGVGLNELVSSRITKARDLAFFAFCLGGGLYNLACAGEYGAASAAESIPWLRLEILALSLTGLALLYLVSEETGALGRGFRRFWSLLIPLYALLQLVLPARFLWVEGAERSLSVNLPFGLRLSYLVAPQTLLVDLFYATALVFLLWLLLLALRARRGEEGRGEGLAAALGLIILALLNDMAVSLGLYAFPFALEYAWVASLFIVAARRRRKELAFLRSRAALVASEEELRRRNEELSILNGIGQALATLTDPSSMLELLREMVGRLFDTRDFYIALHDRERDVVSFPVYTLRGERVAYFERPFGNGITEHVLRTREAFLVRKDLGGELRRRGIDSIGSLSRSFIALPLSTAGSTLGVLALQDYDREGAYEARHVELLSTVAAQAATALENARLFAALRRELEDRSRAEAQVRAALEEKIALLREVHHRVKNNLQVIIALMNLRMDSAPDEASRRFLGELEGQAHTMALVYEQLYQSDNLSRVAMEPYLRELSSNVLAVFGFRCRVELEVDESLSLDVSQAMPCGLVVNELFTNALKYAFPPGHAGEPRIGIHMRETGGSCRLVVADNGCGFLRRPEGEEGKSLGLKLVDMWAVRQLGGSLERRDEGGTTFEIRFPLRDGQDRAGAETRRG